MREMTDKEFRKLNRAELVDIIYELQKQKEECDARIEDLEAQLAEKTLHIENAGSIAEASLALNGVFIAAQAAADQYLQSIHAANEENEARQAVAEARCNELQKAAEAKVEAMTAAAEVKAAATLNEAEAKAVNMVKEAEARAKTVVEEAEAAAGEKWAQFQRNAENLIKAHDELNRLMQRGE